MKIVLLTIGRTRSSAMAEGINMYLQRVNHYLSVELKELPDVKATKALTQTRQKELEGQMLIDFISPGDAMILLDEHGREYTSRQFSDAISRRMSSGLKRLVFVVGGPYGFSTSVYERADGKMSLSQMTFPHEMARLLIMEQIYRAMTILRGEPYHHD